MEGRIVIPEVAQQLQGVFFDNDTFLILCKILMTNGF